MRIHSLSAVTFRGLWEPVKAHHKDTGVNYKNKAQYTLYECTYHPWSDESKEEIKENTDKYFKGRSFSLMDTYDGHHKSDMFQMNYVKIGDSINREDADTYKERGYTSSLTGGTIEDDSEFWLTYTNASYAPFDVSIMSKERVQEVVARHFSDAISVGQK